MPGEMFRTPIELSNEKARLKSEEKSELEAYYGQLSPKWFGTMQYNAGMMLLARVVRLLVQLELRRMGGLR